MAALLRAPRLCLPSSPPFLPLKPLAATSLPFPRLPPRFKLPTAIACSAPSSSTSLPLPQPFIFALSRVLAISHSARSFLSSIRPQPHELDAIASLKNSLSLAAAAPLCFAAISRSTAAVSTPLTVVASGMAKWLELYSGVLMVRVLLSWFPNIPWERQPLQAIRDMCDPYLNLFRNIIPPLFNALDLSPLLAFLVLGMLASILNTAI